MAKATVKFDYICVIDYEATCERDNPDYANEIIEFPIVLVNTETGCIEDCFQSYVRPVLNPALSEFCLELTGITQEQVDGAQIFTEVLKRVGEWFVKNQLGTRYTFAVASDGPWDFEKYLNRQCLHSNIAFPYWASRYIDVRKHFADYFEVKRCGITQMLEHIGLTFEGQPHSGLDDAKNIARILIRLMNHGCQLTLNGRVRGCLTVKEKHPAQKKKPKDEDSD